MRTTVYENQFHDIFIVNEFHKDYCVCTYVKVDRVEPEAVVVQSKATMDAMINTYKSNGFTAISNHKKITPRFGLAIQYFNKDDFDKIKRLFCSITSDYNHVHLLKSEYMQSNVDTGHNWFEIDEDGDVFMALREEFLSSYSKRVALENMED